MLSSASFEGKLEVEDQPLPPVLKGSWRVWRHKVASYEGKLEG